VNVSETGRVVYQAEKHTCRAFPDPKGDGTQSGVPRNCQILSPLDFPASPDSPINAAPYATRIEVAPTREPAVAECQPDIASQVRSVCTTDGRYDRPSTLRRVENRALEVLNSRFPNVRGVQARRTKRTLANGGRRDRFLAEMQVLKLRRTKWPMQIRQIAKSPRLHRPVQIRTEFFVRSAFHADAGWSRRFCAGGRPHENGQCNDASVLNRRGLCLGFPEGLADFWLACRSYWHDLEYAHSHVTMTIALN